MKHALSILAVVVLVVGCKPSLNDGQYGCLDGACPSPLLCWSSDHLCHYGADPGTTDGGPEHDTGAMCSETMVGACPAPQSCIVGAWSGPTPSFRCASDSELVTSNHGVACTMGPSSVCTSPDACVPLGAGAHCMRPCGMPSDPCGPAEQCSPTRHVCVHPCSPGCPGSFTCAGGECLPPG